MVMGDWSKECGKDLGSATDFLTTDHFCEVSCASEALCGYQTVRKTGIVRFTSTGPSLNILSTASVS